MRLVRGVLLLGTGLLMLAALLAIEAEGEAARHTTAAESLLDNRWTPPAGAESGSFSFAVFGDVQDGVAYFLEAYRSAAREHRCELGVIVGDTVNEPTAGNYRHLHRALSLEETRIPLLAVPGNHDVKDGGARFERAVGPRHFALVYRGCLFVGLDGSGAEDRAEEARFLRHHLELRRARIRHRFVFIHRPLDHERPAPDGGASIRKRGRPLIDLAREFGVYAVFAGHRQVYSRRVVEGGGPVLVANGQGTDLVGSDIAPRAITWTLVHVDGKGVTDRRISEEPVPSPIGIARFLAVAAAYPFLTAHPAALVALCLLAAAMVGLGYRRIRS